MRLEATAAGGAPIPTGGQRSASPRLLQSQMLRTSASVSCSSGLFATVSVGGTYDFLLNLLGSFEYYGDFNVCLLCGVIQQLNEEQEEEVCLVKRSMPDDLTLQSVSVVLRVVGDAESCGVPRLLLTAATITRRQHDHGARASRVCGVMAFVPEVSATL